MSSGALNESQREFRDRLAQRTGLDRRVVGAWMLAEENGGAAASRAAANNHNWLNIGYFDSGAGGVTKDQAFKTPASAADATARFLQGKQFGASSGIRNILKTTGKGADAQINAIVNSGWASSAYGGAGTLKSLLGTRQGQAVRDANGGLGKALTTKAVPGQTVRTPVSTGGQPIALPDTGASGLSGMLLQDLQSPKLPQVTGSVGLQAPAFSADRYGPAAGGVQPVGLGAPQQSGVAGQLASLAATRDTSLPEVANAPSSATVTTKVPGVPATSVPSGNAPAIAKASGGAKSTLAWARSVIGVSETTGANSSPRIDQWEKAFGIKGQPWCAIFTSLAVTKGGAPKAARTPAVRDVRAQAQSGNGGYQKGFVNPAQAHAGDLILFGNDHIGLVESVGRNGITMIAGNDSNKVQRRVVALNAGDIVRPKYGR